MFEDVSGEVRSMTGDENENKSRDSKVGALDSSNEVRFCEV